MAVPDGIRPEVRPVIDDAIVQRAGRAHRARDSERSELDLTPSRGFPRSARAVAIDTRAHGTLRRKGESVLRPVFGSEDRAVAALELHETPGSSARDCLRRPAAGPARRRRRRVRAAERTLCDARCAGRPPRAASRRVRGSWGTFGGEAIVSSGRLCRATAGMDTRTPRCVRILAVRPSADPALRP